MQRPRTLHHQQVHRVLHVQVDATYYPGDIFQAFSRWGRVKSFPGGDKRKLLGILPEKKTRHFIDPKIEKPLFIENSRGRVFSPWPTEKTLNIKKDTRLCRLLAIKTDLTLKPAFAACQHTLLRRASYREMHKSAQNTACFSSAHMT